MQDTARPQPLRGTCAGADRLGQAADERVARANRIGHRVNTVTSYRQISANLTRSLAVIAARPDVKRDGDYYLARIGSVKSIDDFLKDDRLFNYAMAAFGLKDMAYGKAFMRKVLKEGVDGQKSFALQLADPRFREFAAAFNFARYGGTATTFTRAQQGTVDRYLRVELEANAGSTDEGVRLALYFARKAGDVASVYGLMGDAALYKVVQTALGLPAAYSNVDVDKQAAAIKAKIDLVALKTPEGLDKFLSKFAAHWQAAKAVDQLNVPQIGLGQSTLAVFSNDALLKLQGLKTGR
ncbi:MAG: DUF1217 domain-containing protein [Rhizobiales bacterium]|nr:DUF1217 domain-containing protein [Hyphomicrobiales bacterium]MBI3674561.1 DUF1217 domain-containing protein [Hyphomicrobiales bacterium]